MKVKPLKIMKSRNIIQLKIMNEVQMAIVRKIANIAKKIKLAYLVEMVMEEWNKVIILFAKKIVILLLGISKIQKQIFTKLALKIVILVLITKHVMDVKVDIFIKKRIKYVKRLSQVNMLIIVMIMIVIINVLDVILVMALKKKIELNVLV